EAALAPHALEVRERTARRDHGAEPMIRHFAIVSVRDCSDYQIVRPSIRNRDRETVLALDLLRGSDRVGDFDLMAEPLQALHQVEAATVPKVRDILLERQPKDEHPSRLAPAIMEGIGDPRSHAVVGLTPREDHLRIVPDLLRQMAEIIRINANAVTANEPRLEAEEVPLG